MAEKLHINDNGFKASKLLLNGGGYLTKQLLLQKAVKGTVTNIDKFLTAISTKKQISKLIGRGLIKSSQNAILYPVNGSPTNLDDWDITLTILILSTCFTLTLSKSEKDLIQDARDLRNKLYGHTAKVEMTDAEFAQNWSSISTALTKHSVVLTDVSCRLHIQDIINEVSNETLSADKAIATLKQWYEWGIEVEKMLENVGEDQQNRFDTYEKSATARHKEMFEQVRTLDSSNQRIQTEVSSMKKLMQVDKKQTVDVIELNRNIAQANINIEAHRKDLQKKNIPYETRMTEETTQTLKQKKIVVLKGLPGSGKTHLAKNIMIHFLALYSNIKPLIMRTPTQIAKILDPYGSFILLIDDFVGKIAVDGIEKNDWQSYVDNFISQIKVSELYVIITIRTAILRNIELDLSLLLETRNMLDVDECLSVIEKREIIEMYAKNDTIDISEDKIERIAQKKCIGVGFPFLCSMMKGQNVEKLFERPIHCIVSELKSLKIHHPTGFCALLMTLIGDNKLSEKDLSKEQTECFNTLQSFFKSTCIDLNRLYQAARYLLKTYLSFNETLFYFEVLHEAIAHSTFLTALEMMPQILITHCPIDTLISNLNLLWDMKESRMSEQGQKFFRKTHQQMLVTKMVKIMSSKNVHKHVKTIAQAVIWNDKTFINEAMLMFNIETFYHCDHESKSLLTYFGSYGNSIVIDAIVESISHVESSIKSEQLHTALTEACMTSQTACVEYLRLKCKEIKKEVVFGAVKGGNVSIVKFITTQFGSDRINQVTEEDTGKNVLHIAAATGNVDIVSFICLAWPSLINKHDAKGAKAIHSAAANGKTDSLKVLLKCDMNNTYSLTDNGETILHTASKFGHIETIRFICTSFPNMIQMVDKDSNTAIHSTACHGNITCLQYLIKMGIDPTQKNRNEVSVAFKAAEKRNYKILNYILESYKELLHDRDITTGITILHWLANTNNLECLKLFIKEGVQPDVRTNDDATILHFASESKTDIMVVKYICHQFKGMLLSTDNNHKNAAHFAAQNGTVDCLKFLTEQGLNPSDKDIDGSTILHRASIGGNITVLRYICDTYPSMIHDTNNNKRNAAHDAAQYGTVECLQFLTEKGINPRDKDIDGSTILHRASIGRNIKVLRYICDTYTYMIHDTDNSKRNAAHHAAQYGTVECLKFLNEHDINPRDKDIDGSTIIHRASIGGNITVLRYICDTYPSMIHDTNNNKRNSAHDAAQYGTVECLKFLTEKGINHRNKDIDGSTIIHRASIGGNITVLRYICDTYPSMIQDTDSYKRNAAHDAAQYGTVECLKFLIENGINHKVKDIDGLTILNRSAIGSNITLLRYICDTYPDMIHDTDNNKRNVVHDAAQYGTAECFKFLTEQGINPKDTGIDGSTILHRSAIGGNYTVLRYICDTHPDMIHDTDKNKRNAAHDAAQYGTVECLKFLIEQGINPRDKDTAGSTILRLAEVSGNIKVLQYISDTYPDMIQDVDNNQTNAALAARNSKVKCLKILREQGINPEKKDTDGSSILIRTAQCANITVLRYICDTYPDMIHDTDNLKRNATHFAAQKGTVECLKFLIEQGINPRDKDMFGSTVIHHAAFVGNIPVLRYICDKYPDMIHDTNNDKRNAAHDAAHYGTVDCLKFLIEQGINPRNKDTDGSSILRLAAQCGNITVLRYICDTYSDMIHDTDNYKRNAAHFAARKGTVECLKFLIEQGINPSDKDMFGSTIIHHAAFGGNITVLRYICDTYPDIIHDTNNDERNAVHDAATNGTVQCLKFLIEQGINPSDTDIDGSSILRLAAAGGNFKVLQYIRNTYPDISV